jgi:DNA polymerase I-like protein with 3'-5' exonuclease and polymerase domains
VPRLIDLVRAAMSGAADLIVPLDVDVKTGTTWAAMTAVAGPAPTIV